MEEITMAERQNDLWKRDNKDEKYAIILMYSVNDTSEPRFITAGPYKFDTANEKLEKLLNGVEQGRFVCISSHFVNPKNVICIKKDIWKGKNSRIMYDGEFYD